MAPKEVEEVSSYLNGWDLARRQGAYLDTLRRLLSSFVDGLVALFQIMEIFDSCPEGGGPQRW